MYFSGLVSDLVKNPNTVNISIYSVFYYSATIKKKKWQISPLHSSPVMQTTTSHRDHQQSGSEPHRTHVT